MKIALLGAGGMGNVHARHYRFLGAEVGVFDVDAERAHALAQTHGGQVFASREEVLAWADAADVCLPNDLHFEAVSACLEAKRPTLVEKPIAESSANAEKLVELAQDKGVGLMVGHVVRCFPEYRRAHELVKAGKVGKPASVRMRRGGGPPRAPWFLDHARSGGVLVDLAVHEFDWLLWTLGPATHLYARSVGAAKGSGPDYGLCTVSFACGAVAHVEATWMDPSGFRTEFEICGSEGMLQHDSRRSASVITYKGGMPQYAGPLTQADDPFCRQLAGFLKAVAEGSEMPVTGREALAALKVAEAARQSSLSGQPVMIA